jgi:membrane-associated phospholipid phosphatase
MDTETTAAGPAVGTRPRDLDPAVDENVGEEEGAQLSGPPVLEPEPDGLAERFANRVGPTNPVRVFVVALLVGYALIVTAMVFLGLTLIHVVLPIGGLAEADADLSEWLADNRSPGQEDASWVGSTLAGGHVIPAVIGLCLAFFLITKRWLLAAFVLFAVVIESASYRATSMIVDRNRPDVERLEQLPVHDSYPSGHTAASIALYGGLLLLLASRIRSTTFRVAALLVGIAIPLFVGWSRMYRGMHYVTDAGAGVLMGLAALAVIVFAARAARAAARKRDAGEQA